MTFQKKMKTVPFCLGKFRPAVGQCCRQCTPDSMRPKHEQTSIGFHNLLCVKETDTRFRGWLVRRVCCVLFVSGCKVYESRVGNRLERVCQSNRVREALTAEHKAPEGGESPGQINRLSPFLSIVNTCIIPGLLRFVGWVMLKMFASRFDSVQVNLSHLPALHRATQEGSLLIYVYVRQSILDCALIPLLLLCRNLKVPYSICPIQVNGSFLRSILQKAGVVLLPRSAQTEQDAEEDSLYRAVMTSLLHELLGEGQAISVGVSLESGLGGQWLARIRQLIKEGSVPDVRLVPVGISYDCVPETSAQVGSGSVLRGLWSLLWRKPGGAVRVHFTQPFSLKEMCESGKCKVEEWLPLQDLLLPVVPKNRTDGRSGQRGMSWLLPPCHYASELKEPTHPESDLSAAITLHLIFSATSSMAVVSTSLVASLLLYKHRRGVSASQLCRDVAWLTEEVLYRTRDVGFGGSLAQVVIYSLHLLAPHLIITATPSRKDLVIVPRPSLAATLHLSLQAKTITHAFITEAVGACALLSLLCEMVSSGVKRPATSGLEDEEDGDVKFDVVLCQYELTERAQQLCHLLPLGFMPPCQSLQTFALDTVDSMVRCGILIIKEEEGTVRAKPVGDLWKKNGFLAWGTVDDLYQSDSDCEDLELPSYKLSQTHQCPERFFFFSSMLAGHLRALCWTADALERLHTPLPEAEFVAHIRSHLCAAASEERRHYESCSEEAARTAVRTLIDLEVLSEERQRGGVVLGVRPLFLLSENRQKLQRFISQFLYN